jgi:magnesium-transporting ATPase (P-type)
MKLQNKSKSGKKNDSSKGNEELELDKKIKDLKTKKEKAVFEMDVLSEVSVGEKYLLTQILKKYKKIVCVSGDHISDCFALSEANVGVT